MHRQECSSIIIYLFQTVVFSTNAFKLNHKVIRDGLGMLIALHDPLFTCSNYVGGLNEASLQENVPCIK